MQFETKKPLIICGCPGSGTSLFAKMLRHCGVFLGADAGDIEDRKFHESACFRKVNQFWLEQLIRFSHAPKGTHQFRRIRKLIPARAKHLVNSIDVQLLMKDFFRGEGSVKAWGWKDPRNSATAAIWKMVFPEARVVVLERKWQDTFREESSNSLAGSWFRRESTEAVRNDYLNPPLIPAADIIRVELQQLIADVQHLNHFLTKVGLGENQITDFTAFKSRIGLEA